MSMSQPMATSEPQFQRGATTPTMSSPPAPPQQPQQQEQPQPLTSSFWQDVAFDLWRNHYMCSVNIHNPEVEELIVRLIADWLLYYCWLATCTNYIASQIRLDIEMHIPENGNRYLPQFKILFQFLCNILVAAERRQENAVELFYRYVPERHSTWRTNQRYFVVNERGSAFKNANSVRRKTPVYCAWFSELGHRERDDFRHDYNSMAAIQSGSREASVFCPILAFILRQQVTRPLECLSTNGGAVCAQTLIERLRAEATRGTTHQPSNLSAKFDEPLPTQPRSVTRGVVSGYAATTTPVAATTTTMSQPMATSSTTTTYFQPLRAAPPPPDQDDRDAEQLSIIM